jgi:hypothetical protein
MSFDIDFKNLSENAEQVEINRVVKNKLANSRPNEDVEIFTNIVYGKDVSKYGKKVDTVMDKIKTLATAANDGNIQAQAELNAIRTVTIQQPLEKRLAINSAMGNVTKVGYNEEMKYEVYELQGDKSRLQASSGSFVFPTVKKRTGTMDTKTATGGVAVDYRELQSGATDGMAMANEQVLTDMTNQMVLSHINALRAGITAATTLKNYAEGITRANVEDVRKKARRFGSSVTILGDYSAVNKLNDLTSFGVVSAGTEFRFPEYVMEEIMKTGLIKNYKGSIVVELPNTYNMIDLNTAGDFYAPMLPTTDLWFLPQGKTTVLQICLRGGLTSMTATDLNTRSQVTRYDWEFGNYVVPEYIPLIGYIYDATLAE